MKKKSFTKKLKFNKQTIANLGAAEMIFIAGGTAVNPVPAEPVDTGPMNPDPVQPDQNPVVPLQTRPCTINQTNCVYCPTNCAWMTSCWTCWVTCP